MQQSRIVVAERDVCSSRPTHLSVFDRTKQCECATVSSEGDSTSSNSSCEHWIARTISAGPLDLQAFRCASKRDDSANNEPRQVLDTIDNNAVDGNNDSNDDDDGEDEDEDENELRDQFYRQQQRLRESQQRHGALDVFLTHGLQLALPDTKAAPPPPSDLPLHTRPQHARRNNQTVSATAEPAAAVTDPLRCTTSHHNRKPRRRRASSAVLPDGVLHVWVYRAQQLRFRQYFASMFARHGLHLRCFVAWRNRCLGVPSESRGHVGGSMSDPVWRARDDVSAGLGRGHFALQLGDPTSPASLPANADVVVEIVCGILVVAAAKLPLLALFDGRASDTSSSSSSATSQVTNEPNGDCDGEQRSDAPTGNRAGIVSVAPQWYPLLGVDAGHLEMALEFVPASAFDDDDDDGDRSDGDQCSDVDGDDDDMAALALNGSTDGDENDESDESDARDSSDGSDAPECESTELQDMRVPNAFDVHLDSSDFEDNGRQQRHQQRASNGSDATAVHNVVVSTNGKTTMYIPSQCQTGLTAEPPAMSPPSTSAHVAPVDTLSPPQRSSDDATSMSASAIDEQLLELFLHGISSDAPESPLQLEAPSVVSSMQQQQMLTHGDDAMASMASSNCTASTCEATDVLSYNALIRDMETALDAERAQLTHGFAWERGTSARATGATHSYNSYGDDNIAVQSDENGVVTFAAATAGRPMAAGRSVRTLTMDLTPPPRSATKSRNASRRRHDTGSSSRTNTNINGDTFSREDDDGSDVDDENDNVTRVYEDTPQGVVLFDLATIPECLRSGFERSTSAVTTTMPPTQSRTTTAATTNANAKAAALRRRSLPVNSLAPLTHEQQAAAASSSQARGNHRRAAPRATTGTVNAVVVTHRSPSQRVPSETMPMLQRRRDRSSLQSLEDQHTRAHGRAQLTAAPMAYDPQQQTQSRSSSRRTNRRSSVSVGKFVTIGTVPGVVRFVGPTRFAAGTWIGIELCARKGKHNGTVERVEYFTCPDGHGIFIRAEQLDGRSV